VTLPSVDADITAKVELLMRGDKTARGMIRESRKCAQIIPTN